MHRRCFQFGVLVSIISVVYGFNLSPNYAQVFQDPRGQSGSYFGYSIGLLRYKTGSIWSFWIVVGAPKANSTTAAHLNISEPGVVYRCTTITTGTNPAGCRPVRLDAEENGRVIHASYLSYKERRDHSWTGATIEVAKEGGLLVCAPKWVNEYYTDEYLLNGICYWKNRIDADADAVKLMPLIHKNEQGTVTSYDEEDGQSQKTSTRRFYYSYGQAGFSAHLTADGKQMLLGAPGILDWIGSVIRCREQDQDIPFPSNRRKRQTPNFTDLTYDVPNPYDASKIDNNGYFGYAVNSGYFRSPTKLSFVGSAPREATLKGTVSIFEYDNATPIQVVNPLEGTQMGEYFGASVCVIDLNNDQLDDLLVGAPLHSLISEQGSRLAFGDEGRVYVFINAGNSVMKEIGDTNKIMGMQIPGARFGSCVSGVGDLNKDGFNDFAVGAPYEGEGRGAIYIYHGQRSGVYPKYSQRIGAQDIHPALTGFGYSISKGLDIDNNNYNDLAVGAFSSCHAVLIRSRPVIKFISSLGNNVGEVGINATGFNVDACLLYQGKNVPPTVAVQVFLSVTSKTEIKSFIKSDSGSEAGNSTYSYYTTLQFNRNNCKTVQIVLVKRTALHEDNIDYTKPFEMKMSYNIDERKIRPPKLPNTEFKGDTFCKKCPVVDPNDVATVTKDVLYATGCKDLICRTDLSVTASFEERVRNPHKIGSLSTARMKIVVDNFGESAFLARLTVTVPGSTPLVRIPSRCQEVDTDQDVRLECDIGNPLRSNSKVQIDLELRFKDLSLSVESLSYQFNATSAGVDENSENNVRVLTLDLEAEADMEIVGVSTQSELVYLPENTQTFSHKYEVLNHGPSPASAVRLEFGIPFAYQTDDGIISFLEVYEPSVNLNAHRFSCKPQGQEFTVLNDKSSEEAADSSPRKRRATATDVDSKPSDSNLLLNTTFALECSDPVLLCMTVVCDPVGPFVAVQSRALLSFKMRANLSKLAPVLSMKDTIVLSSWGVVTISPSLREKQPVGTGTRADTAVVSTLFYGTIREQPIALWIWILAIVAGILLLLIITGMLYKTGFFRRKGKEELEVLKENDGLQLDSMSNESFVPDNEMSPEDAKL